MGPPPAPGWSRELTTPRGSRQAAAGGDPLSARSRGAVPRIGMSSMYTATDAMLAVREMRADEVPQHAGAHGQQSQLVHAPPARGEIALSVVVREHRPPDRARPLLAFALESRAGP